MPSDVVPCGYRDVSGFPGYVVNAKGSVLSSKHVNGRRKHWYELGQFPLKDGHMLVSLQKSKSRRTKKLVHRLVLEAFVGGCPSGEEARHLNGDAADNRLDNLAWGTPKSNYEDKVRHGMNHRDDKGRFIRR